MQIRQRLRINNVVLALSVIAVITALTVTALRVQRAIEQDEIADKLMTAQFERLALRTDYMRSGSERAREQVRARNAEVGELVKSASEKFGDPEAKKTVVALQENLESVGKIFRAILANRQDAGLKGRNPALSSEIEDRLLTQLNMRVYESVLLGGRLQDSSNDTLVSALHTGGGLIVFVFLLMGTAILINSVMTNRTIATRIGRLHVGASAIGQGNLKHRIDIEGNDEFAGLAGSFNTMTAKLRDSYHDLEKEIEVRRETESALRESERRLRTLSDQIPGGAIYQHIQQPDGSVRYAYISAGIESLFGIPAGEIMADSEPFLRLILDEDRQRVAAVEAQSAEAMTVFDCEFRQRTVAGEVKWVQCRSMPRRMEDGSIVWDGVVVDITERKRAEADRERLMRELQRSAYEMDAVFTALPFPVSVIDAGGRYLRANAAFAELFGFDPMKTSRQEMAKSLRARFPDGSPLTTTTMPSSRALAGELVIGMEYIITDRAGQDDSLLMYAVPLLAEGHVYGAVLTQIDITARKRAEEALQKAHNELAQRMEERTRDLREKEVLLKEIHHRVKNNLQVISSLVGMQCDTTKDATVRGVLSDVTDRVRSMALVHEKLYQSADLAHIDFAEYVRSLLSYLWRAYKADTVRLTFNLQPVSLSVDKAVPCGLLLNELAGNALKHAFPGRSEGEVAVSLHEDSNGRICLRVSDNGVGLPPGFDWKQSRSLGLRLVQMLAGQMDAKVEVSNKRGAEFVISMMGRHDEGTT